jgi:hypothetical protein
MKQIVAEKWYKEIKIHTLDDLKYSFPCDFCDMPSLVHSSVDMFTYSHKFRNVVVTPYFYGSLTNQEMGYQRINKRWHCQVISWLLQITFPSFYGYSDILLKF